MFSLKAVCKYGIKIIMQETKCNLRAIAKLSEFLYITVRPDGVIYMLTLPGKINDFQLEEMMFFIPY